jgi:hypothetical protein
MPVVHFVAPLRRSHVHLSPVVTADRDDGANRLEYHKIALEAMGVTDVSSLGKLEVSGIVTPTSGLLLPRADGIVARQTTFGNVLRVRPGPVTYNWP